MVSHWSRSDRTSPQVYRTILSYLADLNNTVVWIVPSSPLIFKSSRPFINPLVTVRRGSIIVGVNLTFMFQSFFHFPRKVEVFIFLSTFFIIIIIIYSLDFPHQH